MRPAGESTRDVGNWLFVVSVAVFALGVILVMVELIPPEDRQNDYNPRMLGPRRGDATSTVRANDHVISGSFRRHRSMAVGAVPPAPIRQTQPSASPPVHDAGHVSTVPHDDFSRRTYLLDSATVAHGYLVPRPNTDQVD